MRNEEMMKGLALDAGAGPAAPIDGAKAAAMVKAAVDAAMPPPPVGGSGSGLKLLAAMTVVIAAAIGTVMLWPKTEKVEMREMAPFTSPSPSPSTATTTPTPTPTIPEVEVAIPVHKPQPEGKVEKEKPEDLLKQANAARAKKDWKAADALYGRVMAMGGAPAQVAAVASGTLHLEHLDDAKGAVARFKNGIGGTASEEARWGLAQAYRALGDDAREAKALDDFLAHHADSPLAERARQRRKALE
jgi:hypothetical protein